MKTLNVIVSDDTASRLRNRGVDEARLGKVLDRLLLQSHGSQSVFGAANETVTEETLLSLIEVLSVETLDEMKDLGDFLVCLREAPNIALILENKTGKYHVGSNGETVVAYVNKTHGSAYDRFYTAADLSIVTVPAFYNGEWHLLCALASEMKHSKKYPTNLQKKLIIDVANLNTSGYAWSTNVVDTLRRAAFEKALREANEMARYNIELSSCA